MTVSKHDNLIVGLDIGTTKTCAIVGEATADGLDVIGIGTAPSKGLRKGVVVNIDATVASIRKAVEEAELMAGCPIQTVYAGIGGGHIKGFNSHGIVAVKDREVTAYDVRRVVDAAKAIAIPLDREVIHILPQEFIVDEQDGIRDPVGMSGVRLEAKVHIVTGVVTSGQNIVKCASRSGLTVADIVLQQLASAEAVLTPDERELGVALLDIGGGTTDVVVFADGAVRHTAVVPMGGNHVTNDIAVGLRTPAVEAERLKRKHGCALASLVRRDETIEVPSVGGRQPRRLSRQLLAEIIQPRVEEIFQLAAREIVKSGVEDRLASGIVITGGATMLEGMTELAEQAFNLPIRRGTPTGIGGLVDVVNSPMYATGVGLVLYGFRHQHEQGEARRFRAGEPRLLARVAQRMRSWLAEAF
ncbi:MAG TPA: cell division protein FtsA [Thermodesulfobacteriota bacterium]|nr:cell division protein FtsA [Thermodesulfobacteriota bacterium]